MHNLGNQTAEQICQQHGLLYCGDPVKLFGLGQLEEILF